ncbi:hypothetical protein ACWCPF_25855 [Streptomyces sp. NPDC001858]
MNSSQGPSVTVVAALAVGAVLSCVAVLMLWLGTEPWTDYAALAAGCLAFAAILLSGFTWIDESTST